jgi:hypothetical protein
MLGGYPRGVGFVGYFNPRLKGRGELADAPWERLVDRYQQRHDEFHDRLAERMARLQSDGQVLLRYGVVHVRDDEGGFAPLPGAAQPHAMRNIDGRIDPERYREAIEAIRRRRTTTMRGIDVYWAPETAGDQLAYRELMDRHR